MFGRTKENKIVSQQFELQTKTTYYWWLGFRGTIQEEVPQRRCLSSYLLHKWPQLC